MRIVVWTDESGFKHRSLIRDDDDDHFAPYGIPLDPPDLRHLDWDNLIRELHNLLVDKGISTWDDVQASQTGVTSSVLAVLKGPIVGLYRKKQSDDSD
jgi:hypothetical protein